MAIAGRVDRMLGNPVPGPVAEEARGPAARGNRRTRKNLLDTRSDIQDNTYGTFRPVTHHHTAPSESGNGGRFAQGRAGPPQARSTLATRISYSAYQSRLPRAWAARCSRWRFHSAMAAWLA